MLAKLRAVSVTNSMFIRQLLAGWNARNCPCLKYSQQNLLKKPPKICYFNSFNLEISKNIKFLSHSDSRKVMKTHEEKNKNAGEQNKYTLTQKDKVVSNKNWTHWINVKMRNVGVNIEILEDQFQYNAVELKQTNAVRVKEIQTQNCKYDGAYIRASQETEGIHEASTEDHRANIKRPTQSKGVKRDKISLVDQKIKFIDFKETKGPRAKETISVNQNKASMRYYKMKGTDLKETKEPRAKETLSVDQNKASMRNHKMKRTDLKETKEPGEDDIELPEEPTTCCMSGCANCVWIEYAEKLDELFSGESDKTKRIILEKVKDPNMRAFLQMELDTLKKKEEDGKT